MERYRRLSKSEQDRILECLYCPFYKGCNETIKQPEDNPDGTCKTKMIFKKGLGLNV